MRTLSVRDKQRPDDGFTLIEMLTAMILLAIVASALASALLASMSQSVRLQHRQVAAQLANRQMQAAQAVDPSYDSNGCTKLLQGRDQDTAASLNASANALNLQLKSDAAWMKDDCPKTPVILPGYGLIPTVSGTPQDPVIINGVTYRVRTLVGTCAVLNNSGCVRSSIASQSANKVYEVLVWVTWSERGCPDKICVVDLSTIIDPRQDQVFDVRNATAPTAKADSFCVLRDTPTAINVLANDSGSLGTEPVLLTTAVNRGTLGNIKSGTGGYSPPAGYTGNASFSYRVVDVNGVLSSTVNVSITVASSC